MPRFLDESLAPGPSESPEIALWRGVLERALLDLKGKSVSDGRKNGSAADEVKSWLGCADFVRVCFAADLDPEATEAEFRRVIAEGERENDGTFD